MNSFENHRWKADSRQFAVAVHVDDAAAFFASPLVIEPGTRALIVDDGLAVGEVPPGSYSLASFADRLQFWKKKQATAILVRQEDVALEVACANVPTVENLLVEAVVRVAVQIDDVAAFSRNLMGARTVYSMAELEAAVVPLVEQALWESIGQRSITELTGPQVRQELDGGVQQALSVSMRRYGLNFVSVQTVSIRHDKFDEHRRKQGEAWLYEEGIARKEALDDLYSEEELRQIRRLEQQNELKTLADNVAVDRQESKVAVELRRVEVRNAQRKALLSEEFNKIQTNEDLKKLLHERDKDRLIRTEETDELLAAFNQRKQDRDLARKHLLAKLDVERTMDIDRMRDNLDHAMRLRRLDHEIELAEQTQSKDNLNWQRQVEKDRREAEHRYDQKDKQLQKQREWVRSELVNQREDDWDDWLHHQRIDRLRGDVEYAQAERGNRVALLEQELRTELRRQELEAEKRRKDWELDVADRESTSQLDRLAAVQRINFETQQRQQQLREKQQRLDFELATLKEDKTRTHELARFAAMKEMSYEALIATADAANAGHLADVKKQEAIQTSGTAVAEERSRMQKELHDAVQQANTQAMQVQQQTAAQMQALLQQAMQSMAHQSHANQPVIVTPGAMPGVVNLNPGAAAHESSPTPARVVLCGSCRVENAAGSRFCSACGKPL